MGDDMEYLSFALILIFCTPLGWMGLLVFGAVLLLIVEAWRGK